MKVVRGELSHSHDGLLAGIFDLVSQFLLLRLPDQGLFQTCNDFTLRVQVLREEKQRTDKQLGKAEMLILEVNKKASGFFY